ncbi:MAG: ABC transporter permease [Deltaproteobacteria bacterium]|nr:ABC transporter permease [Deltaproteobacteria bacterium]
MLLVFFLIDRYQGRIFGEQFATAITRLHTSYFGYVSLGLAVSALASVGLGGVLGQMQSERSTRALEYIMASPVSIRRWAAITGIANLLNAFLQFLIIFLVAVVIMRLRMPRFDFSAALLMLTIASVPLWCLSLLTLSTSIVFRRGDPFGFLLGAAFELLGGVYVPPEVLPRWCGKVSEFLPITPAIRAMQNIVYHGAGLGDVAPDLHQLLGLTLLYLPLSMLLIGLADRTARKKGYYCLS